MEISAQASKDIKKISFQLISRKNKIHLHELKTSNSEILCGSSSQVVVYTAWVTLVIFEDLQT